MIYCVIQRRTFKSRRQNPNCTGCLKCAGIAYQITRQKSELISTRLLRNYVNLCSNYALKNEKNKIAYVQRTKSKVYIDRNVAKVKGKNKL
ncbi:MAG: hypothetical protein J1F32_01985 [Erysipelotrichales bacterium]|nr:hypothetical protein [Erysipelotrichales bacterium]